MKKKNWNKAVNRATRIYAWDKRVDKFVRAIKIAFGILPDTVEEAREMFEAAAPSYGVEKRYGIRCNVVKFTPYWEAIFRKWVDLFTHESQAKGAFFAAIPYAFCDADGLHRDNPLLTYAVEKWLSYLTDALDLYDQDMA